MGWSARQYVQFEDERTRPVRDLLAAVPSSYCGEAVDLGCGPGNSTEVLSAKLPAARVRGIDSSADMIDAARRRLPQLKFYVEDIAHWKDPGPFDVILANAVFHWLPDHASLFPALMGKLAAGGALAVQMPDNLEEPVQRLMREVALAGAWAPKLAAASAARTTLNEPGWYYDLLRPHAARVDIWRSVYMHPLSDAAAVVQWFKGSGLRPFLEPLNAMEEAAFLERYQDAVAGALPVRAGGGVLLPFPRFFLVAIR